VKVTLIGSGNVATALGLMFLGAGHTIVQVAGRNRRTVGKLARLLRAQPITDPARLIQHEGIFLLAVNDDAIRQTFHTWFIPCGIWVHVSGSSGTEFFSAKTENYGVIYPVQTFNLQASTFLLFPVPFLVEASNSRTLSQIRKLLKKMDGRVHVVSTDIRQHVHLAAVILNNFIFHLGIRAIQMVQERRLPASLLYPLLQATMFNLMMKNRSQLQTGPAVRKDMKTIQRHLQLLKHHDGMKKIYRAITENIMKQTVQKRKK
jgi:predicted short-subunit dehydrogenase-like oxidoreductase (DUF2520 family)